MSIAASLSVYEMGKSTLPFTPDFGLLSKSTTTVDVSRLQTELRALHKRLALLEYAAINPVPKLDPELPADSGDSSAISSSSRVVLSAVSLAPEEESDVATGDPNIATDDSGDASRIAGQSNVAMGDSNTAKDYSGDASRFAGQSDVVVPSTTETGIDNSETPKIGKSKKAAAAQATVEAMKADMDDLFNRVEALAASSRRREKAQVVKDRTTVLAGQMELNRIQLAVDSRVTSDELQQAVSSNADKLVALQSSVDTALNDRFRRMQGVVHEQMAGLLQMVQDLIQQQQSMGIRGSGILHRSYGSDSDMDSSDHKRNLGNTFDSLPDDSDEEQQGRFKSAVTDIVQRLLREAEEKQGLLSAFEALQEDHETFKSQMEEKADRQDHIASTLDDTVVRLEDGETKITAITAQMESSAEETQEMLGESMERLSRLEEVAEAASALAADAHLECAATRALVGDSKREALAEAKQEAESIAARAEGRAKAEVQKAKGDARTASENLSERFRRLSKKMTDDAEVQKAAVSAVRDLSQKAIAAAESANARAVEGELSLDRIEANLGVQLHEITRTQTESTKDMLKRFDEGDAQLCEARDNLRRLIIQNQGDLEALQCELTSLGEMARATTEDLRIEVQDALFTMVTEQTIDSNAGGGRSGLRGGVGGGPRGHPRNSGGGVGGSEPEGRTLSSLGAALRKQGQDMTQQVVTLQRSSVGIATVMRKLEAGLHTLSTKDIFWQVVDIKLKAHLRSVGDVCLEVEDATTENRTRITLPKEAQNCLAGDMQRVAKLLATKADYEVIREIAKLDTPEQTDHSWDERVEYLRQSCLRRFTKECRDALDKRAPELRTNFNGEEIRGKFFGKLTDALRVALSKFSPTTPGETLFGKIKLKAKACVACDRPFTPSITGKPGPTPAGGVSGAAVEPANLPDENSYITKDTFRPHTSHGRLGSSSRSTSSPDLLEPQTSVYSVMPGGRASPQSPHVFRGGFKLPKHMKSPLHAPCEGGNQSPEGIGHNSSLLHKSQTMTGLCPGIRDGRPSTSGGMRNKGRPPSSPAPHGLYPSPGGQMRVEENGSVVSAFTMQTEASRTIGEVGGRGGRNRLDLEKGPAAGNVGAKRKGENYHEDGKLPQRDDVIYSRKANFVDYADVPGECVPPFFG